MTMKYLTKSEEETKKIAREFAAGLKGGDVVCLYGELGAGKTTFVKGLAVGLGIKDEILSPTFTLMNVYKCTVPSSQYPVERMVHIDTYRLKNEMELINIGAEDYIGKAETVAVIEWPEKITELLENKKIIKIFLKHTSEGMREISVGENF